MTGDLPFQAVDIDDQNGFQAALYAINALYKRCGMECTDLEKARNSVAKIVKKATPDSISLLLRDWYSMSVEDSELPEFLSDLPEQISSNQAARYEKGLLVNGIEWSALSTIFRCSIAVKIISGYPNTDGRQKRSTVEWKVAVPSPNIFGLSMKTIAGPATACVFLLSHQSQTRKYYPLLPSNQFIFEPGKPLVLKPDEITTSQNLSLDLSQKSGQVKHTKANSSPQNSDPFSQNRTSEKKKQVHFANDPTKYNGDDAGTKNPSQTNSSKTETMKARPEMDDHVSILTSRGSHSASTSTGVLRGKDFMMRSKIYKTVERTNEEHISEVSNSSIPLDAVYRQARRNEREISCIEIYDRIYHSEI